MCNPIYLGDNNPINTFFLNNQGGNLNERIHKHKNKKRPKWKNATNQKTKQLQKHQWTAGQNTRQNNQRKPWSNPRTSIILLGETPITWITLKQSQSGDKWNQGNDIVTVLFKDNRGAFLRFEYEDEIMVEYYHFI